MRTFAVVLALGVVPEAARAQTPATSFEELRTILKEGRTIVVTDASGQQIKGKVRELSGSPPSLVIAAPGPRTFTEGAVTEIRTSDSLVNGALIGGSIGTGLAMWDYFIDPSEPGNGIIFTVAIGLGTAIGAGIDALRDGRRVLYRPAQPKRSLTIAPLAGRDRRGVQIRVLF